jgi:hypothetical protein
MRLDKKTYKYITHFPILFKVDKAISRNLPSASVGGNAHAPRFWNWDRAVTNLSSARDSLSFFHTAGSSMVHVGSGTGSDDSPSSSGSATSGSASFSFRELFLLIGDSSSSSLLSEAFKATRGSSSESGSVYCGVDFFLPFRFGFSSSGALSVF